MTTTLAPNVGALKQRDTLRLCTAGSVDDGKSTFVGRLLYDTKSVLADQVESMERTSTDRGFDGMDLSLLVDGLRACLLYTSPSPRDQRGSRMPSSA